MSRLDLPARKLFLEQVSRSSYTGPHPTVHQLDTWSVDVSGTARQYAVAWVQGTVTEVTSLPGVSV